MKRVLIESPYAASPDHSVEDNVEYARDCLFHSIALGEAPVAFHLLYTQCLDDTVAAERSLGFQCSRVWYEAVHYVAVYTDHGISRGMESGMSYARGLGLEIVFRTLGAPE